jgi:hypothetical protein
MKTCNKNNPRHSSACRSPYERKRNRCGTGRHKDAGGKEEEEKTDEKNTREDLLER